MSRAMYGRYMTQNIGRSGISAYLLGFEGWVRKRLDHVVSCHSAKTTRGDGMLHPPIEVVPGVRVVVAMLLDVVPGINTLSL